MIKENKLAVLIDADNVSRTDMMLVMEEVAQYGTPTVKRAYGDWASPTLAGWKDVLLDIGAVPVQQYAYTTGKNATDAAMIIDAMDFLHDGCVDGFVLISSDSDFTPLALRLRESGSRVYGIGEKKTPKPFVKACDKFVYIDTLRPPSPQAQPHNKPPSQATIAFIAQSISEIAKDDGSATMVELGGLLIKKRPDFDSRKYGFSQLSKLLRAIDRFEVTGSGNTLSVKDKQVK